jgi:hypothetical protein
MKPFPVTFWSSSRERRPRFRDFTDELDVVVGHVLVPMLPMIASINITLEDGVTHTTLVRPFGDPLIPDTLTVGAGYQLLQTLPLGVNVNVALQDGVTHTTLVRPFGAPVIPDTLTVGVAYELLQPLLLQRDINVSFTELVSMTTTDNGTGPVAAPTDLTCQDTSFCSASAPYVPTYRVGVSWSNTAPTRQTTIRRSANNTNWTTIGTVAAGVTQFTDTTVSLGVWYYEVFHTNGERTASVSVEVFNPCEGT